MLLAETLGLEVWRGDCLGGYPIENFPLLCGDGVHIIGAKGECLEGYDKVFSTCDEFIEVAKKEIENGKYPGTELDDRQEVDDTREGSIVHSS